MRATRILFVLLGLACVTGLSISACSDDDSGGNTGKDPATGDDDEGDGDGDSADGNDDGDGIIIPGVDGGTDGNDDGSDDGDGPVCQDGETQECSCADGTSKGEQYCFQGAFQGGCTNCPCNDGDVQSCICQGVGLGQQVCDGTSYGECVCDTSDGGTPAGPCPGTLTCQDLMGMGAVCVDPNAMSPIPGFSLPATCETAADCTAAGYDAAACNSVQFISDVLLMGKKLCVQQCTAEPTTPGGP